MASEEVKIVKLSLKYKDVFVLDELYKLVFYWLRDNDWIDPVYKTSENYETSYLQKDSSSGTKDHIIIWDVEKVPLESAYFKYKLNIKFATLVIKSVEVMHQGKKIKANDGEIKMEIQSILELDYKGEWENHWFLKHFNRLWKKRIYKAEIDNHDDQLREDTYELYNAIKKYLNLKGFLMVSDQEPFSRSMSYAFPEP